MNHDLFGKLKYKDEYWVGEARLPDLTGIAKQVSGLPHVTYGIHIWDPDKEGPSGHQEAAFRLLLAQADGVFERVAKELFKAFEDAYSDEHWRKICRLNPAKSLAQLTEHYAIEFVEILREHHNGVSFLVFQLDTAWNDDHGLIVVYHPEKPPAWTTAEDLYYLVESDEPEDG